MSSEQKPCPPIELSAKFGSWSLKELVEVSKEIANQLKEINKNLVKREPSPF